MIASDSFVLMTESTKQVLIHPRLDEHVHEALTVYARRTRRSVSGAINHIIEQYLIDEDPNSEVER